MYSHWFTVHTLIRDFVTQWNPIFEKKKKHLNEINQNTTLDINHLTSLKTKEGRVGSLF